MTLYDFVRYYGDGGTVHAVRKRGRKHFHLVTMGHPISVVKVPIDDESRIYLIANRTLTAAIETFLAAAERCGITDDARQILTEAAARM